MSARRIIYALFVIHAAMGALDIDDKNIQENLLAEDDNDIPAKDFNVTTLAVELGHPVEEYQVTTEDGYILALHRLPGQSGDSAPVLLVHGVLDSSETWLLKGNVSLASTLANAGHDVWIGDCRGNLYSRGHAYLDVEKDAASYWNFTFYEHGVYDLPAFIDFVLKKTGAEKLNAIAHSQGNTLFYVMGSERPEYNAKVNALIAFAPIAYLSNLPSPLADVVPIAQEIYEVALSLKEYELFGDTKLGKAVKSVCLQPLLGFSVCAYGIVFPTAGSDPDEYEYSFHYRVFQTYPASSSAKNLYHLSQVSKSGNFSKFDYGAEGNLLAYGSEVAPQFDLSKVTMPVALLYGENDKLSTPADVALLRPQLPNVLEYTAVPRDSMNHVDFVWGKSMDQYLYPLVFDIISKYF